MTLARLAMSVLLLAATAAVAQQNPLMPQIHPLKPGEKVPEEVPEKPPTPKATPAPAPQAVQADGLPAVSVHGSNVEIATKDGVTNVFFDLGWAIESAEPVLEVQGDLVLSDDDGHVHGRVPWTLKDPNGLPARFDEHGVGIDTTKSETAQAWFKGAQPSWLRFAFVAKRATFVSGRAVECASCK